MNVFCRKRCYILFAVGVLFVQMHFVLSCTKADSISASQDTASSVDRVNSNCIAIKNLVAAHKDGDAVKDFSLDIANSKCTVYRITTVSGRFMEFFAFTYDGALNTPILSISPDNDTLYWTINGNWLTDKADNKVPVLDGSVIPVFEFQDNNWFYLLSDGESGIKVQPFERTSRDIKLEYVPSNDCFAISLSGDIIISLPRAGECQLLKQGVQNDSYYKDVFLDSGINLTSRHSLYAVRALNLDLEGICFSRSNATNEEYLLQESILGGSPEDLNGRLLYPDGQPRFSLLFVNGGSSTGHGKSLSASARENMKQFVENGGSYVGTCAGAFFASNGYDGNTDYPYYLSIWPGMMKHSGLHGVYSGMFIEKDSPLLRYYNFGGDCYVSEIRHNLGGYPVELPYGTEVLARYDYPDIMDFHNAPSIWAYKEGLESGRIVQTGSHPEEVSSGERRDLTAAMIRYAIDGRGTVSVKGFLERGKERKMNKGTLDKDPAYCRIGDMQCHHFAVYIPAGAKSISFLVKSDNLDALHLMIDRDSYAFPLTADYCSPLSTTQGIVSFPTLSEGIWYLSIRCEAKVSVIETDYGQSYEDNAGVLNGIPYSISVNWNID